LHFKNIISNANVGNVARIQHTDLVAGVILCEVRMPEGSTLHENTEIMKQVEEDGEEFLSTLDSDEELNEVYDLFMEQILSDEDE
jgi:hypothetical protein